MLTAVQVFCESLYFYLYHACMHAFKSSYEHSSKYDTCVSYYHARNARIKWEYLLLKLAVSHARWLNWCKLIGLIPLVQSNRPAHWQARDFYRNMYHMRNQCFAHIRLSSGRFVAQVVKDSALEKAHRRLSRRVCFEQFATC